MEKRESSNSKIERIKEKVVRGEGINRRDFIILLPELLKFVSISVLVVVAAKLGIKLTEDSTDELPSIPVDETNKLENTNQGNKLNLPMIIDKKSVITVINEINFPKSGNYSIEMKYDRITANISGMRVVSLEERNFIADKKIQLTDPKIELRNLSPEEYRKHLKNPRYLEDSQGVKYVSDIINSSLRREIIPDNANLKSLEYI